MDFLIIVLFMIALSVYDCFTCSFKQVYNADGYFRRAEIVAAVVVDTLAAGRAIKLVVV